MGVQVLLENEQNILFDFSQAKVKESFEHVLASVQVKLHYGVLEKVLLRIDLRKQLLLKVDFSYIVINQLFGID